MYLYILIGAILYVLVSFSGFGHVIHVTELSLALSGVGFLYYLRHPDANSFHLGKPLSVLVSASCLLILFFLWAEFRDNAQLLNYCTLFGVAVGVSLLSRLQWERVNLFQTGVVMGAVGVVLVNLFLPDRIFGGWNTNSSIYILPSLLCGMCFLFYAHTRQSMICFYALAVLALMSVMQLQNRSSLICVSLLALAPVATQGRILKHRGLFRLAVIAVIVVNVCLPLFQYAVSHSDIYKELMHVSAQYTDKSDSEIGGRAFLWKYAAAEIDRYPYLGKLGLRPVYLHNFSMDVLTEFGWIGWTTFIIMWLVLFERCFDERNPRTNIFLLALVCFMVLNCFENALLANGAFSIFPYFFFAIAWRLKNHPTK